MISSVSVQALAAAMQAEHPFWDADAVLAQAGEFLTFADPRLEEPLRTYLADGTETYFAHDEFSIGKIRGLRHNCSYLSALLLMDAYLKDPRNGRARILRR